MGRVDGIIGAGHVMSLRLAPLPIVGRVGFIAAALFVMAFIAACASDDTSPASTATPTAAPATSEGLAPTNAQAFGRRMAGLRLDAEGFYVDILQGGRFIEDGEFAGTYAYANTGSDTATLTFKYDDDVYGGSCTLELTFNAAESGHLSFTCAYGGEGQGNWVLTRRSATTRPTVTPRPTATPRPTPTTFARFSEFDGGSVAVWRRMDQNGEIPICYRGLTLPRDTFCLADDYEFASDYSGLDASFLVAHFDDGDASVLQGSSTFRVGGDIQLGWIRVEKRGANRIITHLDD